MWKSMFGGLAKLFTGGVPLWVYGVIAGVALSGVAVAWHTVQAAESMTKARKAGAAEVQASWDQQVIDTGKQMLRQLDNLMADNARLQGIKDEALKQSAKRADTNGRAAYRARTELDGLRLESTQDTAYLAASAHPACRALADRATALNTVFGECAAEYLAMARHADGHANDSQTLTGAWPVLPVPPAPPLPFFAPN